MNFISVDIGTSITKIVRTDENANILNKELTKEKDISKILSSFFKTQRIDKEEIGQIITTGVGSYNINEFQKIPITHVDEFTSIGEGAKKIANNKEIIVASIGTGTAFIQVSNKKEIRHLRRYRNRGRNPIKSL